MKRTTLVICLFLFSTARLAFAQEATLFQKPTVNRTHIVFAYAGDLWSVPREGGDAEKDEVQRVLTLEVRGYESQSPPT